MVSLVEFIGQAEETGLIHAQGEFVLNTTCRQFTTWQQTLACAALSGSGMDARGLKLEVTESLGMGTVAKGIETVGQAGILMTLGCETGQGYLYSRPLAAEDATRWLIDQAGHLQGNAA